MTNKEIEIYVEKLPLGAKFMMVSNSFPWCFVVLRKKCDTFEIANHGSGSIQGASLTYHDKKSSWHCEWAPLFDNIICEKHFMHVK